MSAAERLMQTKPGQVTTCRPGCGLACAACRHWAKGKPRKGVAMGRCSLVKAMHGKDGKLFDGESAIACCKFEERWATS